jgi:hypothetical protein
MSGIAPLPARTAPVSAFPLFTDLIVDLPPSSPGVLTHHTITLSDSLTNLE